MKNFKFSIVICMFLFSFWDISAQDEEVYYNDTLTKKFFQIKKDFSKKTFESTYYTIQIFYGNLNEADSIYNNFRENYEDVQVLINQPHLNQTLNTISSNNSCVQVLGFYDSPEDYVAGNLQSEAFEHVEEENPFDGDMNKQYNADIMEEEYSEEDDNTASSVEVQAGTIYMGQDTI